MSNKTKYVTSYLLEFFSHSRGSTFKEGALPFLYKLSWALEVLTFRADHMHFLWPRFLKIDAHRIQTHMIIDHKHTLWNTHTQNLWNTKTNHPQNMASIVALLVTLLFWTSIYPYFVEYCFLKVSAKRLMIWRICFKIISIFPSKLRCSNMLSDPAWRVYELLCTCSEHGTKSKKQNVDALKIEFSRYPTLSTFSSVAGPKDSITSTLVSYLAFGASTSFFKTLLICTCICGE